MAQHTFSRRAGGGGEIAVALVNNMPPAVADGTSRQFRSVLDHAAERCGARLRIHEIAMLPSRTADIADGYEELAALADSGLDGLLVTGCEPRTEAMVDEPFWPVLRKLVDWADEHTISSIWSCLAAHAAVYRLDGLPRQPLGAKLSGIFECARTSDHSLVDGAAPRWHVPHSRYNGLNEAELARNGYTILSRAPRVGADMFVKQCNSLFVFLQGHPEYGARSLLREYRRDIRRFLSGERQTYPEMPEHYFGDEAAAALDVLREQASRQPSPDLLPRFDATAPPAIAHEWHEPAIGLYARWLDYILRQKAALTEPVRAERALVLS